VKYAELTLPVTTDAGYAECVVCAAVVAGDNGFGDSKCGPYVG